VLIDHDHIQRHLRQPVDGGQPGEPAAEHRHPRSLGRSGLDAISGAGRFDVCASDRTVAPQTHPVASIKLAVGQMHDRL
jgi:hypothetical protein